VVILLRDEGVCASINEQHVNSHYFPDHTLPTNVRGHRSSPIFRTGSRRDQFLQSQLWACVYTIHGAARLRPYFLLSHTQSRSLTHSPGSRPPSLMQVRATTDAATALSDVQYIVHAIPVQSSRTYLTRLKDLISPSTPIFSLSKGLEVRSPRTVRLTAAPRFILIAYQPMHCQ
jgi:glycerol-3-phosphate dehydrogenase